MLFNRIRYTYRLLTGKARSVGLGTPEAAEETVAYLDGLVIRLTSEVNTVKTQRDDLVRAMRGVVACFNSRTESSTCINDHHPSCHEYLVSVLKRVTGGK